MRVPGEERLSPSGKFWSDRLTEPRQGIMLHYDASSSDAGSIAWLRHPDCRAGYQWLVSDRGVIYRLAPLDARVWHAGRCKPSNASLSYKDANSAFYGVAISATAGDLATYPQVKAVARVCKAIFDHHRWPMNATWRIVGHDTEAWPRGRKKDPGKVMPVEWIKEELA